MWHFSIKFYNRVTEKEKMSELTINQYTFNYLDAWSEAVKYAKNELQDLCNKDQTFGWVIKAIVDITR